MSAAQFLQNLFGILPEFFKNEAELRALWGAPDTRTALLEGLAEKGYGKEPMAEMQKVIEAENSDLFDVLAYVAYALPTLTRDERAARAKVAISTNYTSEQRAFIDSVLAQYVKVGVEELEREKLTALLRSRSNDSIPDAVEDLGRPEEIAATFAGFQRYLYQTVP